MIATIELSRHEFAELETLLRQRHARELTSINIASALIRNNVALHSVRLRMAVEHIALIAPLLAEIAARPLDGKAIR